MVQVGNKPTRYYATVRASELGPLFTSAYLPWKKVSRTGSEQESVAILTITGLQPPVFLINSRAPLVTATCPLQDRHPFYRRYRANLPNSLNAIYPATPRPVQPGHLSQFLVRAYRIVTASFFTGPWPQLDLAAIPSFILILAMTALLRTMLVRYSDENTQSSQRRHKAVFRCR